MIESKFEYKDKRKMTTRYDGTEGKQVGGQGRQEMR
jgi:hypothetical protein